MNKITKFLLRYKTVVLVSLAFLVGIYAHSYYYLYIEDRTQDVIQFREDSSGEAFINPLILVADNRQIAFDDYKRLKDRVKKYINDNVDKNNVNSVSFYFRNLNGAEWVGVNEDDKYTPSSMLKVSTLMAYAKLADDDSDLLLEKIHYQPTDTSGQNYKPYQLSAGFYKVKDLLEQMIVESDNDAMHSLNTLHVNAIVKIFDDLRLEDYLSEDQDFMSAREYSRLFRALYNASYISHFYSNQALKLLAGTKFDKGITSATGSTTVSHKFGELTNTVNGVVTHRELHDCGIVYYPNKPYFICVMTKGRNFKDLEKVIADISKITFDYIEKI